MMGLLSRSRAALRAACAATATLGLVAALSACPSAHADEGPLRKPDAVYGQVGVGDHVRSMEIGSAWDWSWQRSYRAGLLTGYTEVSIGQWHVTHGGDEHSSTRLGITPVFRLYPEGAPAGWFVEGGIGLNAISPKHTNGGSRFSTVLNFGDHVAVGRRFGDRNQHELSVRLQHFSNGGFDKPNPGENFLQLRYVQRF